MLIWVCALHCEAKPVIDFYRLKKSHDDTAYDLYRGQDMACIVSGPGKLASAAATAWIAGRQQQTASLTWINLGCAGAAEHDIGSIFVLNRVIDADTGQAYYPVPLGRNALPGHAGLTLSRASTDYRDEYLFDMEASGFMQSALRISSAELVRCLKVVSDNRRTQTGRNRQQISNLIYHHIDALDAEAQALLALNRRIGALEIAPETWRAFTELAHFSQTEKNRLRGLLRYLLNRDQDSDELLERLGAHSTARAIIDQLERLSRRDSEGL